jgi:flagellar basal-body rod modification protein FlgD
MAINSIGQDSALFGDYTAKNKTKDKSSLSNDDFMTLLLVELQNQDPTDPMDSAKVLTQTSELATLESTDNTNSALENLAKSLSSSNNFSSISAIGKTADLGSNAITYSQANGDTSFKLYFPSDVKSGSVEILDNNGNVLQTLDAQTGDAGTYTYDWDGKDLAGNTVDDGLYYATASYKDSTGEDLTTRVGTYPIESVKFDNGSAYFKVGSGYVAMDDVAEIY